MHKVVILTIGNEILSGKTLDTNAHWLSISLDKAGFQIIKKISVGDSREHIHQALQEADRSGNIILITGGLGPTKDDITKKTLAEYFDTPLKLNEEALKRLNIFFKKREFTMTNLNRQQAVLPENCTVIHNEFGTAPAMWFERNGHVFVSMPGVPHEMKNLMAKEVIPRLVTKFNPQPILHKMIHTAGIGESWLAERIRTWESQLPPFISVAYLPQLGSVSLRLTASGEDLKILESGIEEAIHQLESQAGEFIFGFDDESLQSVIGQILAQNSETLSVAESCTGGYICHTLTSVPGCSNYFKGGIVAYDNQIKRGQLNVNADTLGKYGAVSKETVKEMVEGIRNLFGTDYALATSGIAGPDGGTPDKPVGTVFMGYTDADETDVTRMSFAKDRMTNIHYTTNRILTMLWQRLKAKNGHVF